MTDARQTTPPPMTMAAWAQLIVLGTIWGGSFFFARIAVLEIAPLTLVLLRVGIAAAALQLYLAARGIAFAPVLKKWPVFLLLALVNNVIPFSLMFFGQTALGAGAASVLNATTPFWTIIVASLLIAEEKASPAKVFGIVLGIAGTAVMVGPGLAAGLGGPVWAKMALLGMAFSYAFAFVVARRLSGLAPTLVAAGQLSASTLIMLPVVALTQNATALATVGAGTWAAVLGLALLSTAFAYILYFRIVAAAGATNASLVTLIVPVSGIVLGALFLGERLAWFELAGMGLIACGLLVIDGRVLRGRTSVAAAPETPSAPGQAGKKSTDA